MFAGASITPVSSQECHTGKRIQHPLWEADSNSSSAGSGQIKICLRSVQGFHSASAGSSTKEPPGLRSPRFSFLSVPLAQSRKKASRRTPPARSHQSAQAGEMCSSWTSFLYSPLYDYFKIAIIILWLRLSQSSQGVLAICLFVHFCVGPLPAALRCSRTFSPLDDDYAYSYIQHCFFKIWCPSGRLFLCLQALACAKIV